MDKSFLEQNVSNLDAVVSSIETDFYVYKWFLLLTGTPEVKKQMLKQESLRQTYANISVLTALQFLFYTILAVCVLYISLTAGYPFLLLVPAAFPVGWALHHFKKKNLVKLTKAFLADDFAGAPEEQVTLYQLSQFYAHKFSIPALVDTIYASEAAMRLTWKVVYVVSFCVLSFRLWDALVSIVLATFMVFLVVNSIPNYRRLAQAATSR